MRGTPRTPKAKSLGRRLRHGFGREGSRCPVEKKRTYTSKGQAERAAETMVERMGYVLFPYVCRKCGLWHLTSQEPLA